jgi:hypothetical protein
MERVKKAGQRAGEATGGTETSLGSKSTRWYKDSRAEDPPHGDLIRRQRREDLLVASSAAIRDTSRENTLAARKARTGQGTGKTDETHGTRGTAGARTKDSLSAEWQWCTQQGGQGAGPGQTSPKAGRDVTGEEEGKTRTG